MDLWSLQMAESYYNTNMLMWIHTNPITTTPTKDKFWTRSMETISTTNKFSTRSERVELGRRIGMDYAISSVDP